MWGETEQVVEDDRLLTSYLKTHKCQTVFSPALHFSLDDFRFQNSANNNNNTSTNQLVSTQ